MRCGEVNKKVHEEVKNTGAAEISSAEVYPELKEKLGAVNSSAGKLFQKAPIGELRQERCTTRDTRREGPGIKILPKRAWIAHTKNMQKAMIA